MCTVSIIPRSTATRFEKSRSPCQPHSFLHGPMILFNHTIEILALAENHPAGDGAFRFQCGNGSRIGRVLINIHHPRHCVARCFNGLAKKAFGWGCIAFGGEQKVDGFAPWNRWPDRGICLGLSPWCTFHQSGTFCSPALGADGSVSQLRRIRLNPSPNATSVDLDPSINSVTCSYERG